MTSTVTLELCRSACRSAFCASCGIIAVIFLWNLLLQRIRPESVRNASRRQMLRYICEEFVLPMLAFAGVVVLVWLYCHYFDLIRYCWNQALELMDATGVEHVYSVLLMLQVIMFYMIEGSFSLALSMFCFGTAKMGVEMARFMQLERRA